MLRVCPPHYHHHHRNSFIYNEFKLNGRPCGSVISDELTLLISVPLPAPHKSRPGSDSTQSHSILSEHLKMIVLLSCGFMSLKVKMCWLLMVRSKRQFSFVTLC